MKTIFLVIGKTTDARIAQLTDEYINRIQHYLPFEMQVIPELRNAKNLSQEQQKEQEASLIIKSLSSGDYIVLLDEHGKERRKMAQDEISLSQMTFSHQMIRLLFVEQVYRAMTILNGEPYHHE